MLVTLDKINKSYGDDIILNDVDARIHNGDKIGLVGVNGAGKTTLLNILNGELEPDGGEVIKPDALIIGYFKQNSGITSQKTVMEEMRGAYSVALKAQNKMNKSAARLKENPDNEALQKEYSKALNAFEAGGGYDMDVNIKKVLNGMGFSDVALDMSVADMSGGEKTRLSLARLLLENPDLLILDEPTNHLDFETLAWLEEFLAGYRGALLVVSHDRYFLDKIAGKIWDLESGELTEYKGNYSVYKAQKSLDDAYNEKEYQKQLNKIAGMQDFVRRNIARKSTSAQAKSRLKQLEAIETLKRPLRIKKPVFKFEIDKVPSERVLAVNNITVAVGDDAKEVASEVSFEIIKGNRIALIGPNGSGKSSLLKALHSGHVKQGEILWGKNVRTGYYDQENADMNVKNTLLQEICDKNPHLTQLDARSLLGRVLLTGEDVFKHVGELSGGERAKLGLAILMGSKSNLLVLDEPTNHLDLEAREALEDALKNYEGTLLFVSHDRYFVNALSDSVMVLDDGALTAYSGNFDDYIKVKAAMRQNNLPDRPKNSGKAADAKSRRRADAYARQRLADLENRIQVLETEEAELNKSIVENASDYEALTRLTLRLTQVKAEHEQILAEWLELA